MFLCPVHFFPCRPPMTWSDLLLKLENRIPKVDLPEIKGNHRKFRNLVTSYIGNSVYVCVRLSILRTNVCMFFFLGFFFFFHVILSACTRDIFVRMICVLCSSSWFRCNFCIHRTKTVYNFVLSTNPTLKLSFCAMKFFSILILFRWFLNSFCMQYTRKMPIDMN